MKTDELYQQLNAHLSNFIIGIPKNPGIIRILKLMFPPDEAKIALKLPMVDTKLSTLIALYPEAANLEKTLDRMAKRGTVYANQKPGREKVYHLLTALGGWVETPFWGGKDNDLSREMAPLYTKEMRTREFSEKTAQGAPVVRVIPVSESLDDNSEILPYDELVPKIEAAAFRAVAFCPCRHASNLMGEGCDHTVENCLHFGSFARYMVEHDMAREISCEDTIRILEEARQEGFVHVANNMDGHLEVICNCCTCGNCYWLCTAKSINKDVLLKSNYVAMVHGDDFLLCGVCEERCPMEAIRVEGNACATVDADLCIGCGACTPTCDVEAVRLVMRDTVVKPPNLEEWASARLG